MATFLFSLEPGGVTHIHDLLLCLARFDEVVSLEATIQGLRLSSLNISKTAHAAFTLHASSFFQKYHFSNNRRTTSGSSTSARTSNAWTCKVQIRALLAIFRKRQAELRDRDVALERCDFELQAGPDQSECRLVFRLMCKQGVVKTYKLFYEAGEVLSASFDSTTSTNVWSIPSRMLRDVVEYFGPKTDQLDWYYENGKVTFTSYTEKIQSGKEILRQPMHTSVALEHKDFDEFNVQEGLHIGIIVKDFRAIVSHAETMRVQVTARYSRGNRPMQITYGINGISAEFTLMTRGTATQIPGDANRATPARNLTVSALRRAESTASTPAPGTGRTSTEMPPPIAATRNSFQKPSLDKASSHDSAPAPSAGANPDSQFIPAEDDDQAWDEPNYEDNPEMVTWDTAPEDASTATSRRLQDSGPESYMFIPERRPRQVVYEIAPTQRLSQVRGIFD